MYNDIIGSRITHLLSKNGLQQKSLSVALGVHVNIVSCWCRSTRIPNVGQLAEIARFFNVSSDYLLGLTDVEENRLELQAISQETGLTEDSINNLIRVTKNEDGTNSSSAVAINTVLSSKGGFDYLVDTLNGVMEECEQARDYLKDSDSYNSGMARDYQTGKVIDRMELSFFKADEAFRDAINKAFGYRRLIDDLRSI